MSVIFSGSQARHIENTVKTILKGFLQERLEDDALPYKADMSTFGGADVTFLDQEESRAEQAGRPYVALNKLNCEKEIEQHPVDDGAGGVTLKKAARRVWSFQVEAIAGEFSGAVVGASNPIGAEEILSGCVETIIDEGFDDLAALGLEEAEIDPEGEDQEDDELNRINSHVIRVVTLNFLNS